MLASLLVHAVFGAAVRIASTDDDAAAISMVDIEIAPAAPEAEILAPDLPPGPVEEEPTNADTIAPPPEPEPPPEPPKDPEAFALDAGVPDAAPKPPKIDAAPAVAVVTQDAGTTREEPEPAPTDGGVPGDATTAGAQTASAATAANLIGHFPSKHMVSVVLRFDRLRGTEWSPILQEVLSAMPDYKALIADPTVVVADKFDLVAMSSARPKDAGATILAVKSSMLPTDLRDFLDEPGAPVTWTRVTGGVLGTRGEGDRVMKGDTRVFLTPFSSWTVLAKPKDLKGAIDPADGGLDAVQVEISKLPRWIQSIPDLELASGVPDGPAVLLTLAPKSKRWELPAIGLSVEDLPAPTRFTLTAELDKQGFVIRGNLQMHSVDDAKELVTSLEAAKTEALDSAFLAGLLKKARAKNLITNLDLKRSDERVSYATSISIADARVLFKLGAGFVVDYFAEISAPADPDGTTPEP